MNTKSERLNFLFSTILTCLSLLLLTNERSFSQENLIFQTGYRNSACFRTDPFSTELWVTENKLICIHKSFNQETNHIFISSMKISPLSKDKWDKLKSLYLQTKFFELPGTISQPTFSNNSEEDTVAGPKRRVDFWTEVSFSKQLLNNEQALFNKRINFDSCNYSAFPFKAFQDNLNEFLEDYCK
ncbi:MAG: hypothetical protein SFU25_11915 [Candidatus Caenarcaniphilales bacterium]|nr:hypothetical protein [Candidatus Caenarcaniphilales bacterium]